MLTVISSVVVAVAVYLAQACVDSARMPSVVGLPSVAVVRTVVPVAVVHVFVVSRGLVV